MSANAYEILALAMRYVFAVLMVLIVLRAWRISVVDSRRATKLRRLSPDTGIIGEMLVVKGGERARPGMHYPVTLEGTIGSNRRADIRVRHSAVRGRHAFYQMTDEGLFVRGHANARIRDKFGRSARELLLQDGDILRMGDVALMLVLTDGGSEPEEMNRKVLRRRMHSRQETPDDEGFDDSVFETFESFEPEPETDDLFMSNPASTFDRRADEYDIFDDF